MTIKQLKVLYLNYQKYRVKENIYSTIRSNINNADGFDYKKQLEIKSNVVGEILLYDFFLITSIIKFQIKKVVNLRLF